MGIPEAQLETWSHQGSITQSAATYNTIKGVLESGESPFSGHNCEVFLQGSYGNDTNIYAESDVDVVIVLRGIWHRDLSGLTAAERVAYEAAFVSGSYSWSAFKDDVAHWLAKTYPKKTTPRDKAIEIAAHGNRRKSDVIVAMEFRRYRTFVSEYQQDFEEGICFWTGSGTQIINYPKQHSKNLTTKHKATSSRFKPMVRVLKNLRGRLVSDGLLGDGDAPSYYLEGLLYNVPNTEFVASKHSTFFNVLKFLTEADRSKFVCANRQYPLLHPSSPVTWRVDECDAFVNAAVELWNQW